MKKRIVIKLSGRIFGMDNAKVLKDYASFLVKISKICQPIIVAGGGNIARHYITHARSSGADESTLDELGIEISRLNAKLLIYALKNKAYSHPPTTLQEVRHAVDDGLIVVTGGLHPGQSTNGTAALIAENAARDLFPNDQGVLHPQLKLNFGHSDFATRLFAQGDCEAIYARNRVLCA